MVSCRHDPAIPHPPSRGTRHARRPRDPRMSDLAYLALTVAFFLLAIAFGWFCGKVR